MLTSLTQARVIGDDGFLRERTIRVLRELYGFTEFDRGGWCIQAGAWPKQRPRVPSSNKLLRFVGDEKATPHSFYITDETLLNRFVSKDSTFTELLARFAHLKTVEVQELDCRFDTTQRIAQLLTTFHRGGAERIALNLAAKVRLRSRIIALDRPQRSTWPTPSNGVQATGKNRAERIQHALRCALNFGADLVHAHLLDEAELALFAAFPRVVTLHNAANAWPQGMTHVEADRFIGCAEHVSRTMRHALGDTTRAKKRVGTIHNGITRGTSAQTSHEPMVGETQLQVLVVANARQQKRFDRWPAILDKLPGARLHIAGDGPALPHPQISQHGSLSELEPLLNQCHVFVSLSDYEGMSLAELEALQHGLPVVLSRCAAHEELATYSSRVFLVDADDAAAVAQAIVTASHVEKEPQELPAFCADAMARRHEAHYRQVLRERSRRYKTPRHDLVLVCNNFVTGGAQTSARRLLQELRRRGLSVAAVTIQEHPDQPSEGFAQLRASAEIDTFAAPPVQLTNAERTVDAMLEWIHTERVVFWNVIAEHKVLFAELWRQGTLFDVSPGEMYFNSLHRYFAAPRAEHPVRTARDYGALLDGIVVKYLAEAQRAQVELGASTHVISNGVTLPQAFTRPAPADTQPFTLGTLARLSPDKKLEQLLAAFAILRSKVPKARLLIGGEAEAGSEDYARQLRVAHPNVEWLGHVQADNRFFSQVHTFALISEPEGCPNASLEAMAHGVPVVGTAAGGAAEQILDGHTGFLVPRGDSHALAERMAELAHQPQLQQTFSIHARKHCEERFSMRTMADRYWSAMSHG